MPGLLQMTTTEILGAKRFKPSAVEIAMSSDICHRCVSVLVAAWHRVILCACFPLIQVS